MKVEKSPKKSAPEKESPEEKEKRELLERIQEYVNKLQSQRVKRGKRTLHKTTIKKMVEKHFNITIEL